VASALSSDADAVVIDLEDAVAEAAHAEAHRVIRNAVSEIGRRPTHIRVGRRDEAYSDADVDLAVEAGALAVRLPKVSRPDEISRVADVLREAEHRHERRTSLGLYLTIEDAVGLTLLHELAAASPRVTRFVFGERDFMADLGVDSPGPLLDHARATLAVASRAAGVGAPVDGAFIDLDDEAGLRASAIRAKALGFSGKSALHPRQLDAIHAVFDPTPDEIAWAREVVAAYDTAMREGTVSLVVAGTYVDAAVVRRARAIVEQVGQR
jgi:citrate lyase subunit beta/citryl-CoA lyase